MTDSKKKYEREREQNRAFFKDALEIYHNDFIVVMDARHCFRSMERPWPVRALNDVRGLVVHHQGSLNSYEDMQKNTVIGRYDASIKAHKSWVDGGRNGKEPTRRHDRTPYTFGVEHDPQWAGERVVVWQFNDLDAVTWASGSPGADSRRFQAWRRAQGGGTGANRHTVSVNLSGYFSSRGHAANHPESPTAGAIRQGRSGRLICQPSIAQCQAVLGLWHYLRNEYGADGLFGHLDTGKGACPGDTAQDLVGAITNDEVATGPELARWALRRDIYSGYPTPAQVYGIEGADAPSTTAGDYQLELVRLGYDLGDYGPEGDGVDGHWGPASRLALIDFEERAGLLANGEPDVADYDALIGAAVGEI